MKISDLPRFNILEQTIISFKEEKKKEVKKNVKSKTNKSKSRGDIDWGEVQKIFEQHGIKPPDGLY